ncbi:MAG: hypothetical protein HQ582_17410, partial [Planctomycetes bacterium]|nr:hypothetical protein [Planctomycetota bacterium]
MQIGRCTFPRLALIASVLLVPTAAMAAPTTDGLVLWLDADDAGSLARDAGGRVSQWADKSKSAYHARQAEPSSRPQYIPDRLGGKPVVHFDGNAHLNLGQPTGLDFRPKKPFTIAVVYRVVGNASGTFLAKGGGGAGERAYQFYAAPGRQGAIAYGVMRETARSTEKNIAVEVCDGAQTDVHLNGTPSFSFRAGKGTSKVDVLVGARRKNADNSGTFYTLTGDVAEILVYNRALGAEELGRLGGYLKEKYSLEETYVDSGDVHKLVALLATPEAPARLDMLAKSLVAMHDMAVPALRSLLDERPQAASAVAELFVRIAENNQLSSELASLAAGLLGHEDPFVRGAAEWALSMKVGGQNNGQEATWPGPDSPEWYHAWSTLSHDELLEADWVRQATSERIHRDAAKLLASVDAMIERVPHMTADFQRNQASAGCLARIDKQLAALRSIRDRMADAAGSTPDDLIVPRRLWIEARRRLRFIVMENPALDFQSVVFVKQFAPHTVRNITRSYAWKHKPGGDICVLSDLKSAPNVRRVIDGRLGPGYAWGLDLWWDADRVVFAYARQPDWPPEWDAVHGNDVFRLRPRQEPTHIYEIRLDGSGLRQLTDHPYW